jgi:hypothetical protein
MPPKQLRMTWRPCRCPVNFRASRPAFRSHRCISCWIHQSIMHLTEACFWLTSGAWFTRAYCESWETFTLVSSPSKRRDLGIYGWTNVVDWAKTRELPDLRFYLLRRQIVYDHTIFWVPWTIGRRTWASSGGRQCGDLSGVISGLIQVDYGR